MKKKLLFLFFSFWFFSFFTVVEARPLNLEKGGFHRSTEKKETPEVKKEWEEKPPTPPPKEYEIVAAEGSIFPSVVIVGQPWSPGVSITLRVREIGTGVFVPLPTGTEISFKLFRSKDNGATWEDCEERDVIVFPQNNPYVVPFETTEVAFTGPQVVSKVGNKGIYDFCSRYCLGVKIKIKEV